MSEYSQILGYLVLAGCGLGLMYVKVRDDRIAQRTWRNTERLRRLTARDRLDRIRRACQS